MLGNSVCLMKLTNYGLKLTKPIRNKFLVFILDESHDELTLDQPSCFRL